MSLSASAAEFDSAQWRAELWRLLALVLAVKALFLLLDPNLRLFMGDSASYLYAALSDWSPPDRSVSYPFLVTWSAVRAQSAFALVMLQTLMGVVVCALVYWMLRRCAGLPALVATAAALLVAIEPTQLFFERMLMAESAGLLALLVLVSATIAYVQTGHLRWLPLIAMAGVLAISFRMSLLPVVIGLSGLAPLLRLLHVGLDLARDERHRQLLRTGLTALALYATVFSAHAVYQHLYGAHMGSPPGYMAVEGKMRMGLVAPLIRPRHFARVGLPYDFAADLGLALDDHRHREAQMWSPEGLWSRLENELGREHAEIVAKELATQALRTNPFGLVSTGLATLGDYFNSDIALWRLADDFGQRPPDQGALELLAEHLRFDARELAKSPGLVGRAFLSSRWWLTAVLLLLAPLAVLCLLRNYRDPRSRAVALTVGFAALGLVSSHLLFSHIVSFRYLHPMPVFLIMVTALCLRGPKPEPQALERP
ncbi:MAG: hypothetical protein ACXIUM_10550 [Wenzhouxiangella sp.]